jgi:hypothetical protein
MAHKRETDPKVKAWYRTDRMVEHGGKWFFHTRENTIEGPFNCEHDAQFQLETYISLHHFGLLSDAEKLSVDQFALQKTA